MTDIVIPYHLMNEGAELRYCLRGIEQYLKDVGQVFLIGDRPLWVNTDEVAWVSKKDGDMMRHRERNIYDKLTLAVEIPFVSDNFLFMNDDHFMLRDLHADLFPNYARNTVKEVKTTNGPYQQTLENTIELVGPDAIYFDMHCPILINKNGFLNAFRAVDWEKHWGYCIKTVYGSVNKLEADWSHGDTKLENAGGREQEELRGLSWFSTADRFFTREGHEFMENVYPNKSKYER